MALMWDITGMAQVGTGACYISQMSEYVPQRQQSCGAAVSLPVAETRPHTMRSRSFILAPVNTLACLTITFLSNRMREL